MSSPGEQIQKAIRAHGAWKFKLKMAVKDGHHERSLARLEGEFADRSATLVRALKKWKGELQ